jgi:hypothetical protein
MPSEVKAVFISDKLMVISALPAGEESITGG